MAKLDLNDAYQVVPVHPQGHQLLGMQWRDGIFIDTALPFGMRSAPKIFLAIADGLMWMVHSQGFMHSTTSMISYSWGPLVPRLCRGTALNSAALQQAGSPGS